MAWLADADQVARLVAAIGLDGLDDEAIGKTFLRWHRVSFLSGRRPFGLPVRGKPARRAAAKQTKGLSLAQSGPRIKVTHARAVCLTCGWWWVLTRASAGSGTAAEDSPGAGLSSRSRFRMPGRRSNAFGTLPSVRSPRTNSASAGRLLPAQVLPRTPRFASGSPADNRPAGPSPESLFIACRRDRSRRIRAMPAAANPSGIASQPGGCAASLADCSSGLQALLCHSFAKGLY